MGREELPEATRRRAVAADFSRCCCCVSCPPQNFTPYRVKRSTKVRFLLILIPSVYLFALSGFYNDVGWGHCVVWETLMGGVKKFLFCFRHL